MRWLTLKAHAAKNDDLRSIPRTHIIEGENAVLCVSSGEHTIKILAHRTFSKISHVLRHTSSLNKYGATRITSYIRSDHNGIKLDISGNINKPQKPHRFMETKQHTTELELHQGKKLIS